MTAVALSRIALSPRPAAQVAIRQLGAAHGLSASKTLMLTRYFGLRAVLLDGAPHVAMCRGPVQALTAAHPELGATDGLLVYAKTQTHNTPADDWLAALAREVGLGHWESFTLSMNHCASGLSVCHLIALLGEQRPVILLTGEKCFHATTCRQSGAALGEVPVALLFNHGAGGWRIRATWLGHAPRYYANPDRMEPQLRRTFESGFGGMLRDFLQACLDDVARRDAPAELILPYNLNLPLLRSLGEHFGWDRRMVTRLLPEAGHLFCSDVFFNLAQILPSTQARSVFCFAAGMGASFAALLLERPAASDTTALTLNPHPLATGDDAQSAA